MIKLEIITARSNLFEKSCRKYYKDTTEKTGIKIGLKKGEHRKQQDMIAVSQQGLPPAPVLLQLSVNSKTITEIQHETFVQ